MNVPIVVVDLPSPRGVGVILELKLKPLENQSYIFDHIWIHIDEKIHTHKRER